MLILNNKQVNDLIDSEAMLKAIEEAVIVFESKDYVLPDRLHLQMGETTHLQMPVVNQKYFLNKNISISGTDSGRVATNGNIMLSSATDGKLLVLMNSETLTLHRTGALCALAAKNICPETKPKVGIIGAGNIGKHCAKYLSKVFNIECIHVFDSYDGQFELFRSFLAEENINIPLIKSDDCNDLLFESDLIIMATNSLEPVLPENKLLLYGKTFIGLGAYKLNMKEIPTELFRNLNYCFTDTKLAIRESGDIAEPVANSIFHIDNILTLGKLLLNPTAYDLGATRLFKGVGHALLDLYAAQYVYNRAIENNVGIERAL
ncbi:MAG: ornithine cyclodeaminase family protein [Bacteroidales bacterium]|nr:ornithine cyclodeaminase family protein [Bacteroidales bacterium]